MTHTQPSLGEKPRPLAADKLLRKAGVKLRSSLPTGSCSRGRAAGATRDAHALSTLQEHAAPLLEEQVPARAPFAACRRLLPAGATMPWPFLPRRRLTSSCATTTLRPTVAGQRRIRGLRLTHLRVDSRGPRERPARRMRSTLARLGALGCPLCSPSCAQHGF
jgi:hypothetical protein